MDNLFDFGAPITEATSTPRVGAKHQTADPGRKYPTAAAPVPTPGMDPAKVQTPRMPTATLEKTVSSSPSRFYSRGKRNLVKAALGGFALDDA